jgi:transposase
MAPVLMAWLVPISISLYERSTMSAPFRPYDTNQQFLLPPSLREWLAPDHVVYFIMDVVAQLDLSAIYRYYDFAPVKNEKGEVLGERPKTNRGMPAYEPRMMVGVLLYAYVTGRPGSRVIEKECNEGVALRIISGNQHPDHTVISEFRRVHLKALTGLFVQALKLCQKAGLVNLGDVALDGTKVKANASKHKAMSYDRMVKKEAELKAEIEELLRRAEQVDEEEDRKYGKDKRGDELPEELARRESRLKKIQEAKAALEQEANEEAQRKRQEREELEQRAAEEGRSVPGKPPEISEEPDPKAQKNFTDPESRIMKNSDKAFIQGYNAQAAVTKKAQIIVGCEVTAQAADAPHAVRMADQVKENTGSYPKRMMEDAGYFSEENVRAYEERGIEPFITTGRQKHSEKPAAAARGPIPKKATLKERMKRKLSTLAGRAIYALRKIIVEPVFGQIRTRGLARFWLRGLEKVNGEWSLWCTTHNLIKLFRSGRFQGA